MPPLKPQEAKTEPYIIPIFKVSKSILTGELSEINGVKFFYDILSDVDGKNLRSLIDDCKKDLVSGIVCLISKDTKKATIAVGVTEDLVESFDSVQLVRIASEKMSGKGGGGRPDMALSGGSEPEKAQEADYNVYLLQLNQIELINMAICRLLSTLSKNCSVVSHFC